MQHRLSMYTMCLHFHYESLNVHLHLACRSYIHEQIDFKPHPHTCYFSRLTSTPSNNVAFLTDVCVTLNMYCHDVKHGSVAFWLLQPHRYV